MKLLLDQNLSPRLVDKISRAFPGTQHVREVGLSRASDEEIWTYARDHSLTVVSKDTDFMQMSFLYGAPPKIVCIRRGNCSTAEVESILLGNVETIGDFLETDELTYLLLH